MKATLIIILSIITFGSGLVLAQEIDRKEVAASKHTGTAKLAQHSKHLTSLPEPKKEYAASSEIKLSTKDVLDVAVKRLDNTITFFGLLMSVIFASAAVLGYRQNSEFKRELEKGEERLEKRVDALVGSLNLDGKLADWHNKMEEKTANKLAQVAIDVDKKVDDLFNSKYERYIHQLTRTFTEEALLLTSDLRGLLHGRFRNTIGILHDVIKDKVDVDAAKKIHTALSELILEQFIIEQIFNPDINEVKKGLQTLGVHPMPELYDYLKRFEVRYQDNAEMLGYIRFAKNEIEKLRVLK